MLINPYIHAGGFKYSNIPAIKAWYNPAQRNSTRLGNVEFYENLDGGSKLWRIGNAAAPTFDAAIFTGPPPSLGQITEAASPQTGGAEGGYIRNEYTGARFLSSLLNGTGGYAGYPQDTTGLPVSSTEGWIFATAWLDYQVGSGYRTLFSYGSTAGNGARGIGIYATDESTAYYTATMDGNSSSPVITHNVNKRGDWALIAVRFSLAQIELWINGVQYATVSTSDPATGTTAVTMFRPINTGQASICAQLSNAVITEALTTIERQTIEGVLLWRNGRPTQLPIAHPNYSVDPR